MALMNLWNLNDVDLFKSGKSDRECYIYNASGMP